MIGLSLSLCVLDVIEGKVNPVDIEKIVCGTAYPSRDEFVRGINDTYCRTYWKKNPSRGFCVALDLWDKGLLDQPRLDSRDAPNTSQGHWTDSFGCVLPPGWTVPSTGSGQAEQEPQDEP